MLIPTNEQWWKMCRAGMCMPDEIKDADLTKPFVYDRKYGFFIVSHSHHQIAMSLLLAFHLGYEDGIEAARKLKLEFSSGSADYYLEHFPACFKSSVSDKITIWKPDSLNDEEIEIFGYKNLRYLG